MQDYIIDDICMILFGKTTTTHNDRKAAAILRHDF